MSKGAKRERQARELYTEAGYAVQPFRGTRYQESDGFGLFDFVAVPEVGRVVFAQVKSNQTRGLAQFKQDAERFVASAHVDVHYLVCHDREGWRLACFVPEEYAWAVDERDSADPMGAGVVEYLRGGDST